MIYDNMKNSALYCGANKYFKEGFDFIAKAVSENLPAGKYEINGKELYASIQDRLSTGPAAKAAVRKQWKYLISPRQL